MDEPKAFLLYGVLAVIGIASIRKAVHDSQVSKIPIIGSPGFFSRYSDGLKFLFRAPELVQEGYDQYPEGVFRLAHLYRWQYVVCGAKLVKEVAGAPEDVLSFTEGAEENIHAKLTMGRALSDNPYHVNVIRTSLTRNLHTCFADVRDEIVCAFNDVLQLDQSGPDWKTVTLLPSTMSIVSRVSNRLFVGLPLCRNKEYLDNSLQYTLNVFGAARRLGLYPPFLRPVAALFISQKKECFNKAAEFLGPVIQERIAKEEEFGPEWPDKPNDLITWLLEVTKDQNRDIPGIVQRVLITNMAAIHTTSMAFTFALFNLTAHPEHLLPMREEAERVIATEGWSKAALNSMHKIDSFLRESQRYSGNGPVVMARRVVAEDGFRFSNGTVLPYGSHICVAARPTQYDPANYDDADKFDGFRFARERDAHMASHPPGKEDFTQDVFKRQMISTAPEHLPFGHGRHACPGRFFAATELKAILAHVLINYDMKAEVEGVRPQDDNFATRTSPNPTGKILMRKRQ